MVVFMVFCVMVGAALGSFACCQAWRIRYKAEGKKELGKRSVCLGCGKKLKWYENIPIVSWVAQRGKCRRCGKKIGGAEIISEVLGAVFGGLIGMKYLSALSFPSADLWLAKGEILLVVVIFTTMGIIAIYDGKWGEMPTKLLWATVGLSAVFVGVKIFEGEFKIIEVVEAVAILAGIYYILYKISKEKWVGGGDWILCLSIALMLGKPFLALVELTVSNILGLIIMVPARRGRKRREIPFGPFLVVAFMVIFSTSSFLSFLE